MAVDLVALLRARAGSLPDPVGDPLARLLRASADELERLREENENLVKLADYLGRAALKARGEALDG
jgi:hypothetical protein